ncbi:MAG: hypothetical protein Q7K43_04585 [Candidatus Woesearchaeota archaeon]|nr:hypothetical protein [Candidatus Woesearchaeota archaeon]
MISYDDLDKTECHVCKKNMFVYRGEGPGNFVYVHFTRGKDTAEQNRFLYFCPPCWLLTAGEEFYLEGFTE